jgi:hypothetical protein
MAASWHSIQMACCACDLVLYGGPAASELQNALLSRRVCQHSRVAISSKERVVRPLSHPPYVWDLASYGGPTALALQTAFL